uniref:Ubiquitin-like protease family profile domain-containing protein n=1 Tax=Brassica oleracea var. oleracea TaxID=109376 RepID=A0A0D3CM78_BRAOL
MKPIISHSRIKGDKIKFSPKFINPNSLNFTLIWTIIWPNPYDFVSFLRIYHSLVRSAKSLKIERAIQIGPSMLDGDLAGRIMSASSWLKNYEIDAIMYVFRERTTLKRWNVDRVAFMTCVFSDLIAKDYQNFCKGIKKYTMDPLLLQYGKGELLSHGRTRMLWNVDVDRMYVPVWVNCNHWIALCISFVTRNIQEVEAFAQLIPRIVKAVQSLTIQKHLHITPYNVSYVPMSGLNRLQCHCGVYTIKHIECHVLGLDISMVSDENIWGARIKIMWDLWEAANDLELIERMSKYEPIKCNEPPAELSVNMGALFAQMLFERKFRGLRPLDRKPLEESIGSLLTRIFMHHGIDLSDTPCVDTIDRFDAQFFLNTKILHSGKIYRFTMRDGKILLCKLPQTAITSLTSVENMEFMPPAEVLYTPPPPASKRRRGSSSSGPAQTQCEDDTIPDISVDHTPNPSMEYLLPPYTGQFDSGAPPLDGTQQQQFAWTADTLVKLSTMMQTVWARISSNKLVRLSNCPSRAVIQSVFESYL